MTAAIVTAGDGWPVEAMAKDTFGAIEAGVMRAETGLRLPLAEAAGINFRLVRTRV